MSPSSIKQQEALLLAATVMAAVAWWIHQRRQRPKLQTKTPVPSDIEISQTIVREVGLLTMEQVGNE